MAGARQQTQGGGKPGAAKAPADGGLSGRGDFTAKAVDYLKKAVAEDNAGNYENALRLYKAALEYLSMHLKYDTNPASKKVVTAKVRADAACACAVLTDAACVTVHAVLEAC